MADEMTRRDASTILGDYRPPRSFFATESRTILCEGTAAHVHADNAVSLAERALAALDSQGAPLVVGAFPFHDKVGAALTIPETVEVGGGLPRSGARGPQPPLVPPSRVRSLPGRAEHRAAVSALTDRIAATGLRKAVLARALDLEFAEPVPAELILRNLVRGNPGGYTFAVGDEPTLLGASPELLLSREGRKVRSHPLAGSARRCADPAEDKANAAALVASAKDRAEHAMVTDAVAAALRPFCETLAVPPRPELVATPTMWHLGTPIEGVLRDPGVTSLQLAAALHPTPAVCGTPTDLAREVIGELEPFDRGHYAGMVGWMDVDGDGEWAVTIRCAELAGSAMRLYAGGGIVAGSDPVTELDETSAKFQTLLRAMGLELTP
ncbi:isochorismate synthase [Prauserella marina]|nr:isochorismate synthase [Prauserella marina]PWV72609.1 isochorismate synthase [Prauserella marina]